MYLKLGVDIRAYKTPRGSAEPFDLSELFNIRQQKVPYSLLLLCPSNYKRWYTDKGYGLDIVYCNKEKDWQFEAWVNGCKVLFTNYSPLLMQHRILCRPYYPGCFADYYRKYCNLRRYNERSRNPFDI